MYKLNVIYIMFFVGTYGFCPDGCGCDDEQFSAICYNTDLEVMPITLNPNILSLILKHNQFKTVDASISFYPALRYLDISSNNIELLGDSVFSNQQELEELNLSDNNISDISERAFIGLKQLKTINIRQNSINNLVAEGFSNLQSLEFLDCSDNRISNIDTEAFMNLKQLTVLNLNDNLLEAVPTESFNSMNSLKELNLSGNKISVISSHAFQLLSTLVILNLARNNLRKINDEGFDGLISVKEMYLEDNELHKLPTGALSKIINLNTINLSENPIKNVSKNALVKNIKLIALNISHCPQLSEIKAGAFKSNILLKTIEISDNQNLKYIDQNAFNPNTQVESLDLSRNLLNSLSENLLDWHSVKRLQLSQNVWHCDCDIKWLRGTIFNIINNTELTSIRKIKCFSPKNLFDHDLVTADIPDCRQLITSKQTEPQNDELDEAFIVYIATVTFATLTVAVVVFSAFFCFCCRCRRKSQNNALYHASETSRGTDITYYQIESTREPPTITDTSHKHSTPSHYVIRPAEENENDLIEKTFMKTIYTRNPS